MYHDSPPDPDLRRLLSIAAALVALFVTTVAVMVTSLDGSGPSADATAARAAALRSLPPYWTVRRGQTYTTIAARTGLSVDELETLNPRQDPSRLVPGQRIKLRLHAPRPRPKPLGPRFWVVRRGQSFASIAARTGHDVAELQRLNPRLKTHALQPGERMRLRR